MFYITVFTPHKGNQAPLIYDISLDPLTIEVTLVWKIAITTLFTVSSFQSIFLYISFILADYL